MEALNQRGMTFNHVNAGLVAGTTSSYTTTAATAASINGKFATALAVQTNTASPTLDATTGVAFLPLTPNKATILVWGVNAAGAIRVAQGSIEDTAVGVTTTVGAFITAPDYPDLADDFAPIGYQLVRTAPAAATWTPGSSSWTASGVTCSVIQNVVTLPTRPQTA